MIKPGIIYSDQDSVHSQEETKQQEETSGHHPLNHHKHTNNYTYTTCCCFGEKQLNQKWLYILGDPVLRFIWIYLNLGPVLHNHPFIWNDWMALFLNSTHHSSPLTFFLLAVTGHLCQVSKDAEDSLKTPKGLLVLWLRRVGQLASQLHQWCCFLKKLTILTLSMETPWSWSSSSNSSTSSKNMICSRAFSFSRSIRSVVFVTYRWGVRLKENKRRSSIHRHIRIEAKKCDWYVRNEQPVSACLLLSESLCSLWCMSSHKASTPLWSVLNPFWNSKNTTNFIIYKLYYCVQGCVQTFLALVSHQPL